MTPDGDTCGYRSIGDIAFSSRKARTIQLITKECTGMNLRRPLLLSMSAGLMALLLFSSIGFAQSPPPTDLDMVHAASDGDAVQLRDLMSRGGNVLAVTDKGLPVIQLAVDSGHTDALSVLLDAHPELANVTFGRPGLLRTPLSEAIMAKQFAIFNMLLKRGANPRWTTDQGFSPLSAAVAGNQPDVVRQLIQAGADPAQSVFRHGTLLHLAAAVGPDMVQVVLDLGVDPNRRDDYGMSPLSVAVVSGKVDSAGVLLAHGAWVYPLDAFNKTAVTLAQHQIKDPATSSAMTSLLVKHGARLDGSNRPIDDTYLDAVARGDLPAVKATLARGADVNARQRYALNMLTRDAASAATAHPEVLAYLIDQGVNIHARSAYGFTPLHIAAGEMSRLESIRLLVQHGLDVNVASADGETPLVDAVNLNQPDAVKLLLSLGARADVPAVGGGSLLALAQKGQRSALIAPMLARAGAKGDALGTHPSCELSAQSEQPCALVFYVSNGNDLGVKKLLDHGVDGNGHDTRGEPLLNVALLLPKSKEQMAFPLQTDASLSGFVERRIRIARDLIAHGVNVNAADSNGFTAIELAAIDARLIDFIPLLIQKGADPNVASGGKRVTALHGAVVNGNTRAVQLLLDNGANPNQATIDGLTPLLLACDAKQPAIAQLLITHGAKLSVVAANGDTPLKVAVRSSQRDLVALLLSAGADPDYDGGSAPSPRTIAQGGDASIHALFVGTAKTSQ
jgi:ankyrin repeat protein